ncbi:MAG: hypothetical protein ICV79_09115 [Flavisolibacter sp.]|nr:hypothetical protein [Flavisolibacter sp.]
MMMQKALIKLAYRQIIDSSSQGMFENNVFNDSYQEYLMQVQAYDSENRYSTFSELVAQVPKAQSLHYKVGFSIGLYIKELNNLIPHLEDSLGRLIVPFETHQFEIVDSDITNKAIHKVAITYTTGFMILIGVVGDYLVLSVNDESKATSSEPMDTFMLRVQSNLSIVSYKEIKSSFSPQQISF